MRKSYLMMAAAATMLAACTQTDIVQEVNTQQAISFEGFAGKTTRTEIANLDALQGVGFKVWGYKTGGTPSATTSLWASGEDVTWKTSAWTYTNEKTWDYGYSYKFGAIAPKTVNGSFSEAGVYTINGATSGFADNASVTDYLVADVQNIDASEARTVTLDFKHVMSKVSVAVTGEENVTIHKIEVKGWKTGDGTYTSTDSPTWSIDGDTKAGYVELRNAGVTGTPAKDVYETTAEATSAAKSLLIVPQTADLTFKLTYMIGLTPFEKEVPVAAAALAENTHTTYTFTVGAATIKFDAAMTVGWTSNDPAAEEITN